MTDSEASSRAGRPLVSAKVVATRLGCSPVHVHVMARANKITSFRLGKKCVRFDLDVVLDQLGVKATARIEGDV